MSGERDMYVPAWQGFALRDWSGPPRRGPRPFPLEAPHATYFHTARSAIYQLFRQLVEVGRKTVLVPDYHMGNEARAIRAAGARVVLYPVAHDLQPDLDVLRRLCENGADVLFTIHYAGWPQPIGALRALCDEWGVTLVEDCALALFSEAEGRPVGTFGDYAVFCLYKTLPVLDGGVLVQNRRVFPELDALELEPIGWAFELGRAAELWIDRYRGRSPRAGALFAAAKRRIGAALTTMRVERVPVGDIGFDPARARLGMSGWSRRMLERLNYADIPARRRANFNRLAGLLRGACEAVRWETPPGVCPLFFPLLVRNKRAAAQALWSYGIMATELWNEGDPACRDQEGGDAQYLRRHVLELPIHQDVTEAQLVYISRRVREVIAEIGSPMRPAEGRRSESLADMRGEGVGVS